MITIKMQAARWMAACWFRSEWVLLYQKQLKWQWFKLLFICQARQSLISLRQMQTQRMRGRLKPDAPGLKRRRQN